MLALRQRPALPRDAGNAPNFGLDMDAGIDVKEEEKGEHDLEWELINWFSDAAPNLSWHDTKSQPNIVYKTVLMALSRKFSKMSASINTSLSR